MKFVVVGAAAGLLFGLALFSFSEGQYLNLWSGLVSSVMPPQERFWQSNTWNYATYAGLVFPAFLGAIVGWVFAKK